MGPCISSLPLHPPFLLASATSATEVLPGPPRRCQGWSNPSSEQLQPMGPTSLGTTFPWLLPAQTWIQGHLWPLCPSLPFSSQHCPTSLEHWETRQGLGGICVPLCPRGQGATLQGPRQSSFPKHQARNFPCGCSRKRFGLRGGRQRPPQGCAQPERAERPHCEKPSLEGPLLLPWPSWHSERLAPLQLQR